MKKYLTLGGNLMQRKFLSSEMESQLSRSVKPLQFFSTPVLEEKKSSIVETPVTAIKKLISEGKNALITPEYVKDVLKAAVMAGQLDVLHALTEIEYISAIIKSVINIADKANKTLLHYAVNVPKHQYEIVRLLLERCNADPTIRSLENKTFLEEENLLSHVQKINIQFLISRIKSDTQKGELKLEEYREEIYFKELKNKEQDGENKNRSRASYLDNYSAALAMSASNEELERKISDHKGLFELSEKNIAEHAARRVDMFFYILIAYYKKNVLPVQGNTTLQHGKGRQSSTKKNITQACHSSLFSAFVDDTINHSAPVRMDDSDDDISRKVKKSIICGTHFLDSLNSTVELPVFVNNLDCELEGRIGYPSVCRQKSLDIIRNVSLGRINPIQGLSEFLKIMNETFKDLQNSEENSESKSTYLSRDALNAPKHIKSQLLKLVASATTTDKLSPEMQSATDEYIELLLRLSPTEKLKCKSSREIREEVYINKIQEIQTEILSTQSQYKNSSRL